MGGHINKKSHTPAVRQERLDASLSCQGLPQVLLTLFLLDNMRRQATPPVTLYDLTMPY